MNNKVLPQGKLQIQTEAIMRSYSALCLNAEIAKRRVNDINKALAILTPDEQLIIRRVFIEQREETSADTIFDLCDELHIERSQVYRKRKAALEKLTIALFGAEGEKSYAGML